MTKPVLLEKIIANSQSAQAIHQDGQLVYANTAAAAIFGFDNIRSFAKFAEAKSLFAHDGRQANSKRTRHLRLKRVNQNEKTIRITEQDFEWDGAPSVYLELKEIEEVAGHNSGESEATLQCQAETFVLDTIGTAMRWPRTDAGTIEIVNQPFSLADMSIRLYDELSDYAEQNGVSLNFEVTPRAQKIFQGDALKLAFAGSCLIRHAIDKVLGGRVDVTFRTDKGGSSIFFDVADNGLPYRPTDPNIIFDLPPNQLRIQDGKSCDPNLNLPVARHVARFLGGEVRLKINHKSGGLVVMNLPFREIKHETSLKASAGPTFRKLHILVAEDNPANQQVIKAILESLGHIATIVVNGKETVEIVQRADFDLIFMDLHMPIQDGFSATAGIREYEASASNSRQRFTPIFALTADCRIKTRDKALAAGVTGFLTKPIHMPQIISTLADLDNFTNDSLFGQTAAQSINQAS